MNDVERIRDEAFANDVPVMKEDGLAFLLDYLKEHTEIRDILEAGTAVGYSAIRMAMVRWDMTVDTIEVDDAITVVIKGQMTDNGWNAIKVTDNVSHAA